MWTSFSSSYVNKALYDGGTLFVGYKDSRGTPTVVCQYDNVPLDVWLGLLTTSSKGKYINQHVRPLPYKVVG